MADQTDFDALMALAEEDIKDALSARLIAAQPLLGPDENGNVGFVIVTTHRDFEATGGQCQPGDLLATIRARMDVAIYLDTKVAPPMAPVFRDLLKTPALNVNGAPVPMTLIASDLDEYNGLIVDTQHIDVRYMLFDTPVEYPTEHESEVAIDATANAGVFDE